MTKQRKLIGLLVAYLFVGVLVIQAAAGGPSAAQAEIVCDENDPDCEEESDTCNNTTCVITGISNQVTGRCEYEPGMRCTYQNAYSCSAVACSTNG